MRPRCALAFIQILLQTALAQSENATGNNVMVLKNNSLAFSMWKQPTAKHLMKVHLFNYTNWQQVKDGLDTKFHVEEVGPYVYSQQLDRVKVNFNGDLLTFKTRNNFTFLPEASTGDQSDKVFVPNIPLLGVTSKVANASFLLQIAVQSVLRNLGYSKEALLELPVQSFFWGYKDDLLNFLKPIFSIQTPINIDSFGLFVTKNGTSPGIFTINTGEHNINKLNIIEEFNGHESLSYWGNSECNSIQVSDGSIFPPSLLDRNQTLKVFFPNMCRSIPFKYVKDVDMGDGVNLLRYMMPNDVFDDPEHYPANQCYCDVDTGVCPPRGLMNITQCAYGLPYFVSLPHFHLGDPALREQFSGLDADTEHQSYLDIHPTLGIAVRGTYRFQLNIQVQKPKSYDTDVRPLDFLPQRIILPIAWIEMSVEEMPEKLQSLVDLNKLINGEAVGQFGPIKPPLAA